VKFRLFFCAIERCVDRYSVSVENLLTSEA
jgi:hypothetical protein